MPNLSFKLALCVWLTGIAVGQVRAEPTSSANSDEDTTSVTGTEIPYVFKSKTIEAQVKETIEGDGGLQALSELFDIYRDHLDELFADLKPYLKNPGPDVQFLLVEAASMAPERPEAMSFLITILPREDGGRNAASTLYRNYDRDQLVHQGADKLRSALFRHIITHRDAGDAISSDRALKRRQTP